MSIGLKMGLLGIGTCYVVPRAIRSFCTKPPESDSISKINRVRKRLSEISEYIVNNLGKAICHSLKIITDNAWIPAACIYRVQKEIAATLRLNITILIISYYLIICLFVSAIILDIIEKRESIIYDKLYEVLQQCSAEQQARNHIEEPPPLNLMDLPSIPLPLHEDIVFKRYICPITQQPIRHPVGDPNG